MMAMTIEVSAFLFVQEATSIRFEMFEAKIFSGLIKSLLLDESGLFKAI